MWIRTINGIIFIEVTITSQGLIYPKQTNIHHSLEDAKWNLKLYNFLQKI